MVVVEWREDEELVLFIVSLFVEIKRDGRTPHCGGMRGEEGMSTGAINLKFQININISNQ